MAFVVSGQIGVDLTKTTTVPQYTLGTTVTTTDNGMFTYVQVLSSVAQYNAVVIAAANTASNATTTNSAAISDRMGVAQVSIASSSYGWVMRQGKGLVRVANDVVPFTQLYTTGTAGVLDDATVSGAAVIAIFTISSSSAETAHSCIIGSPLIRTRFDAQN